jgi:hypothetical protein
MTDTQENTPNTEAEATAELAKPEDVTAYVEERQEQEAQDAPPADEVDALAKQVRDTDPSLKEAKKASRYERLKRARDQYKAEAEELRQKLGQSSPETHTEASYDDLGTPEGKLQHSLAVAQQTHGDGLNKAYEAFVDYAHATKDKATYDRIMQSADPGQALVEWHNEQGNPTPSPEGPYDAAIQQGRQEQDFQTQLAARDAEVRAQAELNLRIETFAAQNPEFHEAINDGGWIWEDVQAPVFGDLVRRSPLAPEILYLMAKDPFSDNSLGILEQVQAAQSDPIAQARLVGALEQVIYVSRKGGSAPMPRATKAPPPLSQVRGGANPPRDLHSLASKGDDASDYIKARRSAS